MKSMRRLGGRVAWSVVIGAALGGAVACGDGFGSETDCKVDRTCAPQGNGGADSNAGGTGEPDDNQGGSADGIAGGVGGGAGVGEPAAECTTAADCDNADASDGQETCFNSKCVPGNTPPSVVSVTPANDAVEVEPDGSIVIELSEALDGTTVTSNNVKLLDGDSPVPGALSYADNKITFTPEKPLALLTAYQVSLSTTVTDAAGAGLAEAFNSSFSVRDGSWSLTTIAPAAFRELSPNVQLNADGDALIAWLGKGSEPCPATAVWFNRGEPVGQERMLSNGGTQHCRSLSSAVSANGFALLSWFEEKAVGQDIVTAEFRAGKWGGVTPRSQRFDDYGTTAAAEDGTMHYFGSYNDVQVWQTSPAGVWSASGKAVGSVPAQSRPVVAVARNGHAVAAWRVEEEGNQRIVVSSYSTAAATWSTAVTLPGSLSATSVAQGEPQVAFDNANAPIVVWQRGSELVSNRYASTQGTWAGPVQLAATFTFPAIDQPEPLALAFDGQAFVAAFTAVESGDYSIYVTRYNLDDDSWGSAELVNDAGSNGTERMPRLTADAHGNLLVVWASLKSSDVYDLVAQRFNALTGEWSGPAAIEGATMKAPELPLGFSRYALGGNQSGLAALTLADVPAGGFPTKLRLASFF
jgi:hypothetical protein